MGLFGNREERQYNKERRKEIEKQIKDTENDIKIYESQVEYYENQLRKHEEDPVHSFVSEIDLKYHIKDYKDRIEYAKHSIKDNMILLEKYQ